MARPRTLALAGLAAAAAALLPAGPAGAQKGWYEKAVKKVEAKFEPAAAKPGEVVTLKFTVALNDGYHTYPTAQADPGAAGFINAFKFPAPEAVVFVGKVADPKGYEEVAEPELGVKALRKYAGEVTFTRKAVVSPKAAAGAAAAKVTLTLTVCDKSTCFAPKAVPVDVPLKVLDGPAVPVPAEFAAEVAQALAGK